MFAAVCDCVHVADAFVSFLFLPGVSVTLYTLGGNMLTQVDLETGAVANGAG